VAGSRGQLHRIAPQTAALLQQGTPGAVTDDEAGRDRMSRTGRVGQSPRFRTMPKGTSIVSFSLGVRDDSRRCVIRIECTSDHTNALRAFVGVARVKV
jgi:hypothetical protein